ncbi:MAG: beta-ketoacyl synthase N-terminal-like domain-containing protein [Planctomycetota bacterium]|nr:beta-ketoacyl synthase N-terminal-like domain-containing protein [Planctomycetota bacterium]
MTSTPSANRPAIVITGVGLVTPLGHSAWETFAALLDGRTLADRAAKLPDGIDPVDLVKALGSVGNIQHISTDPAITLAERAAGEALFMADPKAGNAASGDRRPIDAIVGSSKGAVHALVAAADRVAGVRRPRISAIPPPDAHLAVALGPHGYLLRHLRQRLPLGQAHSTVAACASSLTALHEARLSLIRSPRNADGGPRRMLVVTSEAALLPLFIHSYARLGVLPPLTPAGYRPRPLDERRSGFALTELAAAIVLETVDVVRPEQVELLDTAIAAESSDVIRTTPGMPALAHIAQRLLGGNRDEREPIDLIHPHATGTVDNDPAELAVYADALAGSPPPDLYAHKGALGHGLGAAGLVSLVLAWLCARSGRRPPMPWLDQPIASQLSLVRAAAPRPIRTQAVFAAGFGGHVAGAVIRRK